MQLRTAAKVLREAGVKDIESYEMHVPFIFNRKKLLGIMGAFPNIHCSRTLYGNFYDIGGERRDKDVKVFERKQEFDRNGVFLSTQDSTFSDENEVCKWIKESFPKKSRFEKLALS